MEDEQAQISSTWPLPPPFWKDFADDQITRTAELRIAFAMKEARSDPSPIRLPEIPYEVRNLQPPVEPKDGTWRVFGDTYRLIDELPKLEDQGIRRLFPNLEERDQDGKHFDRATILKRLAKSLLLNYLELIGRLATNPELAEEKITDIRDMFINFHHLTNEYRPHQARESLIMRMQAQLDKTKHETDTIRAAKDKAEREIEGLGSLKIEDDLTSGPATEKQDVWAPDRELWKAVLCET
ncbi:mediator complex, subunit Med7 [Xylariomycetidae sp. FL2044]|nr:mediator complex, subunit Med7 [Xylariomycetidae sp. FL2044]